MAGMPNLTISIIWSLNLRSQPSLKFNTSELSYSLNKEQVEKYNQFSEDHKHCGGHIETCFSHESGIGVDTKFYCTGCGDEMDVTDISKW